ncbi:MAG: flagellar hook-basal body complex protein [Kordiimonadaceae bacterium]|nr:flagellar hook-basal body complex protein [Kordiimonadaceae bacterium]
MAFTALAAGVSGLQAFTEGVGVIADNITNVNTIGYKETRSRFSTLVTETSSTSSYSPGGVRAFAESLVSKQGLLQPSGSATDLAVDGAGFFVVRSADTAEAVDGELVFTRSGAFSQDSEGFFKNTANLYLMGWRLDATGQPPSNLQSASSLEPINITQLNGISQATSNVQMRVNLDSEQAITTPFTLGSLSAGTIATADFETNIQIFDSLGREHTVVVAAQKTAANQWNYEYYFDDPSAVDATAHPNGLIARGVMEFNPDGTIDISTVDDAAITTLFGFDASGTAVAATLPGGSFPITYATGGTAIVDPGSLTIDFGTNGTADGWALSGSSSLISKSVDGATFGSVSGISIDNDGIVSATFENGLSLDVYQIPLAIFDNPNGLQRKQGNAYGVSSQSGEVTYQQAATSGAGKVAPNSLEQSTVDLANEFAELIKVQRAFSASTRIITTADQILEELVRI